MLGFKRFIGLLAIVALAAACGDNSNRAADATSAPDGHAATVDAPLHADAHTVIDDAQHIDAPAVAIDAPHAGIDAAIVDAHQTPDAPDHAIDARRLDAAEHVDAAEHGDAPIAAIDAAIDAPVDAAIDAPVDASVDAPVDAAIDAPADASVDAALDGSSSADASLADAASPADGRAPGLVTVTVFNEDGSLAVGQLVAFLNADNSVVLETSTDDNGAASATMAGGGSVTAALNDINEGSLSVFSWLGVEPGDQLIVNAPQPSQSFISVEVDFPDLDAANSFTVLSSCATNALSGSSPAFFSLDANCSTSSFYVEAFDDSNNLIATIFAADQPVSDGAVVDLTQAPYQSAETVTLSVTNSTFSVVGAALELIDGSFLMGTLGAGAKQIPLSGGSGSLNASLGQVPGADAFIFAEGLSPGGIVVEMSRAALAASVSLDFSTTAIPLPGSLGTYDTDSSTLSWPQTGNGSADMSIHEIAVTPDSGRLSLPI